MLRFALPGPLALRVASLLALRVAGLLALCTVSLLAPRPCAAYCRTTTEAPPKRFPADQCYAEGYPLFWPTRQLEYAINERGVPGIEEDELRAALDRAFGAWTDVVCGGVPIDLEIEQAEQLTELMSRPKDEQPRTSVVMYVSEEDWIDKGRVLAITNMRYSRLTGHILGADLLLNGANDFAVCPETGCEGSETDLLNVVTHEAGHFLGLAHSDVPGSTMWWNADAQDTDKRTLESDDERGLCAIYGPNARLGPPEGGRVPDGRLLCSLAPGPHPTGGVGLATLGLAGMGVWLRRRRCR